MAAPAREPSFDVLATFNQPWTAQLALDLLPENNGPRIEIFRGSVTGDGYRPIATATAGDRFVMSAPFAFSIDPHELTDEDD